MFLRWAFTCIFLGPGVDPLHNPREAEDYFPKCVEGLVFGV